MELTFSPYPVALKCLKISDLGLAGKEFLHQFLDGGWSPWGRSLGSHIPSRKALPSPPQVHLRTGAHLRHLPALFHGSRSISAAGTSQL